MTGEAKFSCPCRVLLEIYLKCVLDNGHEIKFSHKICFAGLGEIRDNILNIC